MQGPTCTFAPGAFAPSPSSTCKQSLPRCVMLAAAGRMTTSSWHETQLLTPHVSSPGSHVWMQRAAPPVQFRSDRHFLEFCPTRCWACLSRTKASFDAPSTQVQVSTGLPLVVTAPPLESRHRPEKALTNLSGGCGSPCTACRTATVTCPRTAWLNWTVTVVPAFSARCCAHGSDALAATYEYSTSSISGSSSSGKLKLKLVVGNAETIV